MNRLRISLNLASRPPLCQLWTLSPCLGLNYLRPLAIKMEMMIRANQGHSIPTVELAKLCTDLLTGIGDNFDCVHGTFFKNVSRILNGGLLAGGVSGFKSR